MRKRIYPSNPARQKAYRARKRNANTRQLGEIRKVGRPRDPTKLYSLCGRPPGLYQS